MGDPHTAREFIVRAFKMHVLTSPQDKRYPMSWEILESLSSLAANYGDFGLFLTPTAAEQSRGRRKKVPEKPTHDFSQYSNIVWEGEDLLREPIPPKSGRYCMYVTQLSYYGK